MGGCWLAGWRRLGASAAAPNGFAVAVCPSSFACLMGAARPCPAPTRTSFLSLSLQLGCEQRSGVVSGKRRCGARHWGRGGAAGGARLATRWARFWAGRSPGKTLHGTLTCDTRCWCCPLLARCHCCSCSSCSPSVNYCGVFNRSMWHPAFWPADYIEEPDDEPIIEEPPEGPPAARGFGPQGRPASRPLPAAARPRSTPIEASHQTGGAACFLHFSCPSTILTLDPG